MVVRDAAIASNRGKAGFYYLTTISNYAHRILRAFLVEEAKIVKKVIKQQQKAATTTRK